MRSKNFRQARKMAKALKLQARLIESDESVDVYRTGKKARTEAELVKDAQSGHGAAFDELAELCLGYQHRDLLKIVRNYLRAAYGCDDYGKAEDLTQEAVFKAWKSIGAFRRE